LLEIYINNEGFEVVKAYDGKEAYQKFKETNPDCLVLDIMMPEMDGLEVVKKISEESKVPILMLSAKTADIDKIRRLAKGADDYVVNVFNALAVVIRMKSLLRRSSVGKETQEQMGHLF